VIMARLVVDPGMIKAFPDSFKHFYSLKIEPYRNQHNLPITSLNFPLPRQDDTPYQQVDIGE
jgi:hypothetical protein